MGNSIKKKGSGTFEATRVIQLTYNSRCYLMHAAKMEKIAESRYSV